MNATGASTMIKDWQKEVLQDLFNSLTLRECKFARWFLERSDAEDKIRKKLEDFNFRNLFKSLWRTLWGLDEEDEVTLHLEETRKLKEENFSDIAPDRMCTIEQMVGSYRGRMTALYAEADALGDRHEVYKNAAMRAVFKRWLAEPKGPPPIL